MAEDTFLRITNRDIYNKIEEMLVHNRNEHSDIVTRLDRTNGKVKLNRWIATTALSLIILIMGTVVQHWWGALTG